MFTVNIIAAGQPCTGSTGLGEEFRKTGEGPDYPGIIPAIDYRMEPLVCSPTVLTSHFVLFAEDVVRDEGGSWTAIV